MDSDDVLHILIKDLTDVLPDIELYDKEGNVEDTYPVYANSIYCGLYKWWSATDLRYICAAGWHIPSVNDTITLMLYLDPAGQGGTNVAGGKMKEVGLIYWETPNTGADNSSGFGEGIGGHRYHRSQYR